MAKSQLLSFFVFQLLHSGKLLVVILTEKVAFGWDGLALLVQLVLGHVYRGIVGYVTQLGRSYLALLLVKQAFGEVGAASIIEHMAATVHGHITRGKHVLNGSHRSTLLSIFVEAGYAGC